MAAFGSVPRGGVYNSQTAFTKAFGPQAMGGVSGQKAPANMGAYGQPGAAAPQGGFAAYAAPQASGPGRAQPITPAAPPQSQRTTPIQPQAADPQFDEYMKLKGVGSNASTQTQGGYDAAVTESQRQWGQLTPQQKAFYLQQARNDQGQPGPIGGQDRVYQRPVDAATQSRENRIDSELQVRSNAIRAEGGSAEDRAGRIFDSRAAAGKTEDRGRTIASLAKEISDEESMQAQRNSEASAKAASWQQTRDQYDRPDGLSDQAFDYLVGQESAGQSRWAAPTQKVWMELMNQSLPPRAEGGGYSVGAQQSLANQRRAYEDQTSQASNGRRRPGQMYESNAWAPWKGRIQKKPL